MQTPENIHPAPASALSSTPEVTPTSLNQILQQRFQLPSFRPAQAQVCLESALGRDVLLVMPTGAGKSLCYQIPGLARGGTTLVISPLLALIEDQVQKLQHLGLRAERIHSGRTREQSQSVCRSYLAGELDYIFIAPERLGVPGFIDLLKRKTPALIAIDEAHCISQWGHDFRPDYRLLGARLNEFRPSPIIALTATATPLVQNDVCAQLGMRSEKRFIQGFRRTNIAIECIELSPGDRPDLAEKLLTDPANLPAIVYAPTRKKAEEMNSLLRKHLKSACYHAGMNAKDRDQVQHDFLQSKLDVIVATIAFGMGIDKPDVRTVIHMALPHSVEGYYQEIGRAGRDGLQSRAYLLHSFADQKTHEYFFDLSYPDKSVLQKIRDEVAGSPQTQQDLEQNLPKIAPEVLQRAIAQLMIHGGLSLDGNGNLQTKKQDWLKTYNNQVTHKKQQLRMMTQFPPSNKCRMLFLVEHFGETKSTYNGEIKSHSGAVTKPANGSGSYLTDDGTTCGHCDNCNPHQKRTSTQRLLNDRELDATGMIWKVLQVHVEISSGKLHAAVQETLTRKKQPPMHRGDFERLLAALERVHYLELEETSFSKGGEEIYYKLVRFAPKGQSTSKSQWEQVEIQPAQVKAAKPRKRSAQSSVRRASRARRAR